MPTAPGVGSALRGARLARGKSLSDVATLAGISAATLSRIETDKQGVDVALLLSLARILNVPAADMLGADGNGNGHDTEEGLVTALAALPAADRARIVAAAVRRRPARRSSGEMQTQIEGLLVTIDLVREELTDLHQQTRRRPR